jgi:hypothetical protein
MPRLYGKKMARRRIDNRVRSRIEERDAIIWEIDESREIVNLKIQGSDTLIKAHYHQVIHTFPGYLKVGAAVNIRFRRGNRGFVDVIGSGRAIPSPVDASGPMPPVTLANMILSGLIVTATDPPSMAVSVSDGVFRINNKIYVFSGTDDFVYIMNEPAPLVMGFDPVIMGPQYYTIAMPPAPTTPGYGRYDIIVIGTDSVLDVISGTAVNLSTTAPEFPTIPPNHILVDWVFIMYGDTVITQSMIGQKYSQPNAESWTVVLSGGWVGAYAQNPDDWPYVLGWSDEDPLVTQPSCTITITATDQYGGLINFGGARATLTKAGGLGRVRGGYTDWHSSVAESSAYTSIVFYYEREQPIDPEDPDERYPVFSFEVLGFSMSFSIVLACSTPGFVPCFM